MVSLEIFGTILMQLFAVLFWEHHFSRHKVHGNNSERILVLQFFHRIFKVCSLYLFFEIIQASYHLLKCHSTKMKCTQWEGLVKTFQWNCIDFSLQLQLQHFRHWRQKCRIDICTNPDCLFEILRRGGPLSFSAFDHLSACLDRTLRRQFCHGGRSWR